MLMLVSFQEHPEKEKRKRKKKKKVKLAKILVLRTWLHVTIHEKLESKHPP